LKPGINYEPTNGINVQGISEAPLRTQGIVLKFFTSTHGTAHLFHGMGEDFGSRYGGY
jgi:hypothetical protein